jgi:lipopolysaccharide export system permease protein
MKLLDKYILKKFLTTFFFVVMILVSVICVIDFTEKNDDFIKTQPPASAIIVDYYLNLFPYWANMLSPITVFIATVFVTAKLAAHTEIIAILSSGVSFRRLMVPYVIGAALIGLMTFGLIGWVIPNANKTRVAFELKYIKNPFYFSDRNIHIKVAPRTYVYMESYSNQSNVGYQFTMEDIDINNTKMSRKLSAERVSWQPEKENWKIENYTLRTFNGMNETISHGQSLDTIINLSPKDFSNTYGLNETLTLTELQNFINELRERGADNVETYLIEKYERFTYPFAIVILTIIGVILSARKARGGTGGQIALGFALAFVYILFVIVSRSLAQGGGMDPLMATWMPNTIFSFVGLILYKTVPR